MTRFTLFVVALIVALLVVWAIGHHAVSSARVEPAPVITDASRRFPNHDENEPASRFFATMSRLDEKGLRAQRESEVGYIKQEVASPLAATAAPPEPLARYYTKNAATIEILRAQLVSNPPPAWKQRANDLLDTPQPDLILISQLFTMFAAHALAQHHSGSDNAAWSDLAAIRVLTESLVTRPEVPSVIAALSGSRMLAAVAAKLPAPAPPWWSEFVAFDPRPPLVRALEYETWALRTRAERYPAGEPDDENGFHEAMRRAAEPFVRPLRVMQADARARDIRDLSRQIATADPCRVQLRGSLRRWSGWLERMDRFLVEREGVAKLLAAESERAKTGAWPAEIDTRSVCHSERWTYKRSSDTIEIVFTGHLPPPQTRIVTPLQYRR